MVYKDSPDEIIVKTNAEAPVYADWIIKQHGSSYVLGKNVKNFKPEHEISFRDLLDPQHDNYLFKLSWFQLYNRVLVCSHLGGLQRLINVAMQHDTHLGFVGIAAQELDAMRLVMHRNINHALLHLKHNEQIPMFDRTKYKLQASVVPGNVINCVAELSYLSAEIESIIDKLEQLDIEHLISEHDDGVMHVEQLKGNDSTDLFL